MDAFTICSKLCTLYTIFTNFEFFRYTLKKGWYLDLATGKSVWGTRSFFYPEFDIEYPRRIPSFTEVIDFEKMHEIPFSEYFIKPKLDSSQEIIFHSEMHNLFDKYFGLEEKKDRKSVV